MLTEYYKLVNSDNSDFIQEDLFWHPNTVVESGNILSASRVRTAVPTIRMNSKLVTLHPVEGHHIKTYEHIHDSWLVSSSSWEVKTEENMATVFGEHGEAVVEAIAFIDGASEEELAEIAKAYNVKTGKREIIANYAGEEGSYRVAKKAGLEKPFLYISRTYEYPYVTILQAILLQDKIAAAGIETVLAYWNEIRK